MKDGRVFFEIIDKFVKNKKKIKLFSDGKIKRAYCYIPDVIEAIFIILKNGKSGHAYNVGNPFNTVTINKLISILNKISGRKPLIQKNTKYYKNYSQIKNRNYFPNISKIKKLGWKPKYNLREGLNRIYNYYQ